MVNVEIERVCFSYPGADILHDVTFCIGPGEMTGLIGPNGSGKSTLIKCIDTILKPKGSILLNGKDVLKMDQVDLAKNIGLVPQHGTSAMDSTVFETVLMGRRPHSAWRIRDEDIDKVADTLDRLNIGDLAMRDFASLSGGQKQMVLLARAICQEPQVLLLDEPTSALDIRHQLEVLDIVNNLVKERHMSAIIALHDLNLGARYTDSMVILRNGKIFSAGKPDDLYTPDMIEEVYGVKSVVLTVLGKPHVVPVSPVKNETFIPALMETGFKEIPA
ncbi:ABC transporter ATP-binding protein [Methanospirillum purgamenti]|jgi:iron complex transport system ATP-binding protein|uniref:Cobalamin import ATP-binding protein BtuD n=1 Tax=Methanospirillum hungatei TaxID=2203 RepID=A0A8F5VNY6_METHU|nr:ABC transporter ATP-binding protein [Methanospirillum hungatei]NLW77367.1 ABC transporter ATP-binding protein [Methanomicrobiales archaeon]QXO95711.1 ABC transporter ATP-binding protein [Methanospirillum hungatei]